MRIITLALLASFALYGQSTRVAVGRATPYTDSAGYVWAADTSTCTGTTISTSQTILGTVDPTLYQGGRRDNLSMGCTGSIDTGVYRVSFKFAEIRGLTSGQQIFNIYLNNTVVRLGFDIRAYAPAATAYDVVIPAFAILEGSYAIYITQQTGGVQLNAFALELVGPGLAPYSGVATDGANGLTVQGRVSVGDGYVSTSSDAFHGGVKQQSSEPTTAPLCYPNCTTSFYFKGNRLCRKVWTASNAGIEACDPLSILAYGADPTGVADSTTAIQAAIDALGSTGETVMFPKGIYKACGLSITTASITLQGASEGMGQVYNASGRGSVIRCLTNGNTITFSGTASNIAVLGLAFEGSTSTGAHLNLAPGTNLHTFRIEGNSFNGKANAIKLASTVFVLRVKNNMIGDQTGDAILLDYSSGDGMNDMVFAENWVRAPGGDGIKGSGASGATNIQIHSNTFEAGAGADSRAIRITGVRSLNIWGNDFENWPGATSYAIFVSGNNINVWGNDVWNAKNAIYFSSVTTGFIGTNSLQKGASGAGTYAITCDTCSKVVAMPQTTDWAEAYYDNTPTANYDLGASGVVKYPSFVASAGKAFASLGTPAAGAYVYCTDCTVATPCTGAGAGAWAFRVAAGTWNCPF